MILGIRFVYCFGFSGVLNSAANGSDRRLFLTFLLTYEGGDAYDLGSYLRDYVKKGEILFMIEIIYDIYALVVFTAAFIRIVSIIRNITKR